MVHMRCKMKTLLLLFLLFSCKQSDSPVTATPEQSNAPIEQKVSNQTAALTDNLYSCKYSQKEQSYCDEYRGLDDDSLPWAVQECQSQGGSLTPAAPCTSDNQQSTCSHSIPGERPIQVVSTFYRNESDPELVMECANKTP
jgi:hypothetical protein